MTTICTDVVCGRETRGGEITVIWQTMSHFNNDQRRNSVFEVQREWGHVLAFCDKPFVNSQRLYRKTALLPSVGAHSLRA